MSSPWKLPESYTSDSDRKPAAKSSLSTTSSSDSAANPWTLSPSVSVAQTQSTDTMTMPLSAAFTTQNQNGNIPSPEQRMMNSSSRAMEAGRKALEASRKRLEALQAVTTEAGIGTSGNATAGISSSVSSDYDSETLAKIEHLKQTILRADDNHNDIHNDNHNDNTPIIPKNIGHGAAAVSTSYAPISSLVSKSASLEHASMPMPSMPTTALAQPNLSVVTPAMGNNEQANSDPLSAISVDMSSCPSDEVVPSVGSASTAPKLPQQYQPPVVEGSGQMAPTSAQPSMSMKSFTSVSTMQTAPALPNYSNLQTQQEQQHQQSHSNQASNSSTDSTSNAGVNRHHLTIDINSNSEHELENQDSNGGGDDLLMQGGRLWQAARREAEQQARKPQTAECSRFAESLMERTRSRADPNALIPRSPLSPVTTQSKPTMVKLSEKDDAFILSTNIAKKRVRVVQLLLIGFVGLLLGFLGNFFVSTSCHYASVQIPAGSSDRLFWFHFGLWKYSPIDSVFQGYSYCYKYDAQYTDLAPIIARVANIVALLTGAFSIFIVWLYLIMGRTSGFQWKAGVYMAVFAGLSQLGTLSFLWDSICSQYKCMIGPGGILSIFTSLVWFALAYEMRYHMPVAVNPNHNLLSNNLASMSGCKSPMSAATGCSVAEQPSSLVTSLEMSHLDDVTREYISRVSSTSSSCKKDGRRSSSRRRNRSRSSSRSPRRKSRLQQHGTYQAPNLDKNNVV